VKHAGPDELEALGPLLGRLRRIDGLAERRPGVFYHRSRAFLHFHADPAGVFADVRFDGVAFERVALAEVTVEDFVHRVEQAVAGHRRSDNP
jgi:hypothetical protein